MAQQVSQENTALATGAEPGSACVRLSELPVGARARLCGHADRDPAPRRLVDLGFVPETPVLVVRRAPLGDPVELEIRGYRICVRRDELEQICVRA